MEKLKQEKEQLETKVSFADRKLMEIPRLEENVLRNAKSMIRQQEITNTKTKIENKRNEEEVKKLIFWKNKTQTLEDMNAKLQLENSNLQIQNRIFHTKLIQLSNTHKQLKNTLQQGEYGNDKTADPNGASTITRPSSAPSYRRSSSEGIRRNARKSTLKLSSHYDDENANNVTLTDGEVGIEETEFIKKATANQKKMEMKLQTMNSDEILKIKHENIRRKQQVAVLAQKLSFARAYPLLALQENEEDDKDILAFGQGTTTSSGGKTIGIAVTDHNNGDLSPSKKQQALQVATHSHLIKNDFYHSHIFSHNYMIDELESTSSNFLREEKQLEEERLSSALNLQTEYNKSLKQKKKSFPKHVNALRNSKSFSNYLDDLEDHVVDNHQHDAGDGDNNPRRRDDRRHPQHFNVYKVQKPNPKVSSDVISVRLSDDRE
jgi:hypothetical protein